MRNPRCSLLTVLAGSALLSALPVQPAWVWLFFVERFFAYS